MVSVPGCAPKAVGRHSPAGGNAAANACSRKALTGTTRATRKLDFQIRIRNPDHKGNELTYSHWRAALRARSEIRKSHRAHCDQLHFGTRIAFRDDSSSPTKHRVAPPNRDRLRCYRLYMCRGTIPRRFRRGRIGLSSLT
jgi:hypothetical protein